MGRKMAAFLQTLSETGCRPGELWALRRQDIDTERRTIAIEAEKHNNSRHLRILDRCLAMLYMQARLGRYVFHRDEDEPIRSLVYARRSFVRRRRRLARKLVNPRLNLISFRTLRHFRASTLYYRAKDLALVKQQLGHRSSTMRYTHLVNFESDDWISKAVKTTKEAEELTQAGFEYVATSPEGYMLFRKRK